jgi:hypothetical protein
MTSWNQSRFAFLCKETIANGGLLRNTTTLRNGASAFISKLNGTQTLSVKNL